MFNDKLLQDLLSSVFYSGLGVVLFCFFFIVIVKMAPFSVIKEIEEDQNVALSILIGAVFIGISIIIASAIH